MPTAIQQALSSLAKHYADAVKTLNGAYNSQLVAFRADHVARVKTENENHAATVRSENTSHTNALHSATTAAARTAENNRHAQSVKTENARHAQALKDIANWFATQGKTINTNHAQNLTAAKTIYTQCQATIRAGGSVLANGTCVAAPPPQQQQPPPGPVSGGGAGGGIPDQGQPGNRPLPNRPGFPGGRFFDVTGAGNGLPPAVQPPPATTPPLTGPQVTDPGAGAGQPQVNVTINQPGATGTTAPPSTSLVPYDWTGGGGGGSAYGPTYGPAYQDSGGGGYDQVANPQAVIAQPVAVAQPQDQGLIGGLFGLLSGILNAIFGPPQSPAPMVESPPSGATVTASPVQPSQFQPSGGMVPDLLGSDVWGLDTQAFGGFSAQVLTRMIPRVRTLTTTQRINDVMARQHMNFIEPFSQWEAVIAAAVSGVSSVASAAVSQALAPSPARQPAAPVLRPAAQPSAQPSGIHMNSLTQGGSTGFGGLSTQNWELIGVGAAALVGVVLLTRNRGGKKR